MADNNNQDFKFNLDVKDTVSQLDNVRNQVIGLGDAKNLSGLINGFTSLAGPVALAGAAIFAIKASLDLAKEGESIERINNQFDEMAKASGQSAGQLKDDLEKSLKGMVDMEDAMSSANKVMYEMGPNAAKIPEMFELARKAGKVFGGETTDNFEKISQAIVNGNTRMLRSIGLNVDAEAAQKKYAIEIGKTVQSLTAFEKQQALLNAVMEKGKEKFKGVSDEGESISGMLKQITVALGEFKDMIAVAFGKSDYLKSMVRGWRDAFQGLTEYMKGKFGSEFEQAQARVADLSTELNQLKYQLLQVQEGEQGILGKMFGPDEAELKKRIESVRAEMQKAMAEQSRLEQEQNAQRKKESEEAQEQLKNSGRGGPTPEEIAKQKTQQAAFNRELLQIKEQRINAEMQLETNADEYRKQLSAQREITEQQYDARIAEIKEKSRQGDTYNATQAAALIEQIEAEKTAKIKAMRAEEDEAALKAYDNQVKYAQDAAGGIAAAFAQGAARARKEMSDYGKQGQQVFGSVKNNAVAAFKAMGDGSKSAGDAIKGFLLNSVADYVEMKGQAMLLEGLWPPNPVAIAAGGGMIALAAAMRSAAGGATGGGAAVAGAGGAGGGAGFGPSAADVSANKPEPEMQKQKSVTIQVQGNYFETEQSKQRMLEMIRENTDATDFKYQQIGVG